MEADETVSTFGCRLAGTAMAGVAGKAARCEAALEFGGSVKPGSSNVEYS